MKARQFTKETPEQAFARYDKNFDAMLETDKWAKEHKQLVGRYISEPFADGRAYYQIIKENKKSVKIKVVRGIGDDWVLPYFGESCNLIKKYVVDNLKKRDALEKIFGGK